MESLAVKYRPRTFDDVVGQSNTVKILVNQLSKKKIKQSYLFCGGAGTGKTTIARIFAKQINSVACQPYAKVTCPHCNRRYNLMDLEWEDSNGITVVTCKCGKDFMEDESIDWRSYNTKQIGEIIEIDAASNNGVDNIRDLRETCKFKPIGGGYKVYIIDEVHMLSTGAFNALLKTLEEPPAHAVFILCTTDPQKIPATILSRVQRFDFKRMTTQQTIDRLMHICELEKKSVDNDALEYLAKLANGGMRDAISLLDTCLGYQDNLDFEAVAGILGQANYYDYLMILKGLHVKDSSIIVEKIEQLHADGKDLKQFIKGLAEFILEVRKYNMFKNLDYSSIPSYLEGQIAKVTEVIPDNVLADLFKKVVAINNAVRYETHPKLLIEGELICLL